ncbi:MAG: adenosine deaminase, partial [Candidatus Delongbacteria bacterium]|nr:adenosine deaminase [Candidatus Delongbacteria bacterium]
MTPEQNSNPTVTDTEATPTLKYIESLPKVELHCHLDGSIRLKTMIELARQNNVDLPSYDPDELKRILRLGQNYKNLEDYLKVFDYTLSVMQGKDELYRTAWELAEDAAAENCRHLEVRYSPILHIKKRLGLTEVMEAVLEGLADAGRRFNIHTGVIVCGIRNINPETSMRLAELSVAYKNRGVVGFDLAGVEHNFPAKDHVEAFYLIHNNNINCTVHAGEAYGPESIHQALHYLNAHRIGHGTRLKEDGDLLNFVNDRRIPIEMCPTSNVQTKAVASLSKHPLKFY